MPILSLLARLGLDKTGFDAGLNTAGKQVNKFGAGLKGQLAGAFGIAAMVSFTRNLVKTVSHIEDLSKSTGVAAETLQELEYAAKQSGSSVDAVATAFRALSKARMEALKDPNSGAGQVFKAMGIGAEELKSQSLEQTFKRVANVFKTSDFGASELAMVNEILGRAGDELLPMFKAGLEEAATEARNLGLIIGDEMVMAIDDAGDAMDRFGSKLKATVAPAIKFIVDRMRDVYDIADILVGNIGAIAGTLAGGGSIADARQAGRDHVFGVIERREKEDAAREEKLNARRQVVEQVADARVKKEFQFAPKAEKEKAKQAKGFSVEETALGRIGAFTGAAAGAGLNPQQAMQLDKLQKIHDLMALKGIIVKDVK